jgi:hypothetical protein
MEKDSDEKIANTIRAASMGIQVVEFTFNELNKFKKQKEVTGEKENPAR